ncbi:MAG: hypothetical protein ACTHLX_22770, partial [Candidatus Binatia bacterium]
APLRKRAARFSKSELTVIGYLKDSQPLLWKPAGMAGHDNPWEERAIRRLGLTAMLFLCFNCANSLIADDR